MRRTSRSSTLTSRPRSSSTTMRPEVALGLRGKAIVGSSTGAHNPSGSFPRTPVSALPIAKRRSDNAAQIRPHIDAIRLGRRCANVRRRCLGTRSFAPRVPGTDGYRLTQVPSYNSLSCPSTPAPTHDGGRLGHPSQACLAHPYRAVLHLSGTPLVFIGMRWKRWFRYNLPAKSSS